MKLTASILTISDRAFQGTRADLSGPAIETLLIKNNISVIATAIVPDESVAIENQLRIWVEKDDSTLIFTTGGTGFAARDITPEATRRVIERETPGISEYIRQKSSEKTNHAMLSRAISGIAGQTLIVNLPGSPKAACDSIEFILPVLPHAVEIMLNNPDAEQNH